MEDYQDVLPITTPEGLALELVLAGPGTRIVAGVLDLVVQGLIGLLLALGFVGLADVIGQAWTVALGSIAAFLLVFFYDVAWELLADGRTPGKRVLGLRVVRDDGRRVDGLSSVVRNVLRIIELPLVYAPAIVMVTLSRRHQRVGDLVGGTLVVFEPRGRRRERRARAHAHGGREAGAATAAAATTDATTTGTAGPGPGREVSGSGRAIAPPERAHLDLSRLGDRDRATARAFAGRHRTIAPKEREQLAAAIAAALRPRVLGASADLSDEQLVLAVARLTYSAPERKI